MNAPLRLQNVSKSFRRTGDSLFHKREFFRVLVNISFTVEPGQLLTITGPNGAGKTTLLKILAGLLTPDTGQVSIEKDGVRFVSGDERSFYWRLTARQNLQFFAALEGLTSQETHAGIDRLAAEWRL